MKKLVVAWVFFVVFLSGCSSVQKVAIEGEVLDSASPSQFFPESAPQSALQEMDAAQEKGKHSIAIAARGTNCIESASEDAECIVQYAFGQQFELKFSDTENPQVEEQINKILNMVSYSVNGSQALDEVELKKDTGETQWAYANLGYFESYDIACLNQNFLSLMVYTNQLCDDFTACDKKAGITFDLTTGKQLKLNELLLDGGMEALSQAAFEQLVTVSNYFQSDADSKSIVSDYFNGLASAEYTGSTVPWCLSDDGLLLFLSGNFEANALGTQTILLRYSVLDKILKPMYMPREINYSGVTLRAQCVEDVLSLNFERIEMLNVDSSGDFILISTDTYLPDLRISQIAWVNGQAVAQSDLYAADLMTKRDAVCLEISTQNELLDLQLQYTSDEGSKTVYLSMQDDELIVISAAVGE